MSLCLPPWLFMPAMYEVRTIASVCFSPARLSGQDE